MVDYVLNSVVVVVDIELPEVAFVDGVVTDSRVPEVALVDCCVAANSIVEVQTVGSLAFLTFVDLVVGADIDSFGSQTDGGHNLGIHVEVYVFDVVVCHCVVHPPFLQMKIEISADHGFGEVVP